MQKFKYAALKLNDVANNNGVAVSFYTQGCPHRCFGCHNPETWEFNDGIDFTDETMQQILDGLMAYGIKRNLSILGGEPLCSPNIPLVKLIIQEVRKKYNNEIDIYIWSGYTIEQLITNSKTNSDLVYILQNTKTLIDGKFDINLKNLSLKMRGSSNQRIIEMKDVKI